MLCVSEENRSGILEDLEGGIGVTPFTPLRPDFRDGRETRWMQVVRKQALGPVSCLFAISAQVPKLDVAGSIPVSRSIESITWEKPKNTRYSIYSVFFPTGSTPKMGAPGPKS